MDLVGQRFGRWVVTSKVDRLRWNCRCDCGTERVVYGDNMRRGVTKSCGCYSREAAGDRARTHGMSATTEHRIWRGFFTRCENPNNSAYARYGGAGITICDRWRESFENFYADMGPRPSMAHSIDRIDNTKGYSPENCRWATRTQQIRNRSTTVLITVGELTLTPMEWSKRTGLKRGTIDARLRRGLSPEACIAPLPR